jgi:hypothetical protein
VISNIGPHKILEDSYGTAGSFKTGGATRFHSDPSGKEVEVLRLSRFVMFIA